MEFTRFIELPVETKIQIINKCTPVSYGRLRRICRFVDEFCENNRKHLGVYCCGYIFRVNLFCDENGDRYVHLTRGDVRTVSDPLKRIEIPLTPDHLVKINKTLSGFTFSDFQLGSFGRKNFDITLNYFLDAVPDLKVNLLLIYSVTAKQVERVMASRWKIGGVNVQTRNLETHKILEIAAIRTMDPFSCYWVRDDYNFTEQDIVQLARGKKHVRLYPSFLSASSHINVLKTIAQNWKNDGQFPIRFHMSWENDKRTYMEPNISGVYSEIMGMEACYLGSFYSPDVYVDQISNIWIRKVTNRWQFLRVYRYDDGEEMETEFTFQAFESTFDFIQKLTKAREKIYGQIVVDESSLYEACQSENMDIIKKFFINIS